MSRQLTTIATFATAEEAHLARNVLENESIAAYLDAENVAGALGLRGSLWCEVKLQVAEGDAQRAGEVLARAAIISQDNAKNSRTCRKCGAAVPSGFEVCWSCQAPLDGEDEECGL